MPPSPKLSLRSSLRLARSPHKPPPPGIAVEGAGTESGGDGKNNAGVPSVDAILARARPRVDKALRRRESEIIERERALLEAEKRAQEELRTLREQGFRLTERERECSEREMLLDIRENNVAMRESLLSTDGDNADDGSGMPLRRYESLRGKLESRERELRLFAEKLDRREKALAEREESLNAAGEAGVSADAQTEVAGELEERLAELQEREKMLAEREAFIEQSENVLFNRAQELQEIEAQLSHMTDSGAEASSERPRENAENG